MRLSRAISLLVAIILAATMSQALVAPAQAAPEERAKPNHDLIVRGTEVGNTNHFVIYGRVTTYPKVFIFRSIAGGTFRLYRKVKTDNQGRFRTRIYQYKNLRTCFRAGVPETSEFDQVIRPVGCIY